MLCTLELWFGLSLLSLLISSDTTLVESRAISQETETVDFCRPCGGSTSYYGLPTIEQTNTRDDIDLKEFLVALKLAQKNASALRRAFKKALGKHARKTEIRALKKQWKLRDSMSRAIVKKESKSLKDAIQHTAKRLTEFAPNIPTLRSLHKHHHAGVNTPDMQNAFLRLQYHSQSGLPNILCSLHQMAGQSHIDLEVCTRAHHQEVFVENRNDLNLHGFVTMDHLFRIYRHTYRVFQKVQKKQKKTKSKRNHKKQRKTKSQARGVLM